MTLTELLPAIRALPAADRARLAQLLVEEDDGLNDLPEKTRRLLPPPGTVVDMGKATVDAIDFETVMQFYREKMGDQ